MNGARFKRLLLRMGVPVSVVEYLKQRLFAMGRECYRRRIASEPDLQSIVREIGEYGSLATHYAYKKESEADINLQHVRVQLALCVQAIRDCLDGEAKGGFSVLDVGDSDGLFLRLTSSGGVSLNIAEVCVRQVKEFGGHAVRGDLERLPFRDGSFDWVICCETLEHLENPILGLKELARVANRKILVSIPWVRRTRIHPDSYQPGAPPEENHVFEFARDDFERIITHAGLAVRQYRVLAILPPIYNPIKALIMRLFYRPLMFDRLQFFELAKARGGPRPELTGRPSTEPDCAGRGWQ